MLRYLNFSEETDLPCVENFSPYKAVIIADQKLSKTRRAELCTWLVATGCQFALAWGSDCTVWHDDMDLACIDFAITKAPGPYLANMQVMHSLETLEQAFWVTKHAVRPELYKIDNILLLHIAAASSACEIEAQYLVA